MGNIVGKSNTPVEVVQDRMLVSAVTYETDARQSSMGRAWVLHSPARVCNFGGSGLANRSMIFWVKNNSSQDYIIKNINISATEAVKTLGTVGLLFENEIYTVRKDVRINVYYGVEPTFAASGSEDVTNLNIGTQVSPVGIDFRIPATPAIANFTITGSILNCMTYLPQSGPMGFRDFVIKMSPGTTLGITVNCPDANVFQNFAAYCTIFQETPGVGV